MAAVSHCLATEAEAEMEARAKEGGRKRPERMMQSGGRGPSDAPARSGAPSRWKDRSSQDYLAHLAAKGL